MTPRKKGRPDDEPTTPTGAGLWIRVAANLVDRKVTWRLVELIRAEHPAARASFAGELPLDILRAAAEGYLVNLWGRVAEHTAEGVIDQIPHAQLEHWAGWAGNPGAFAAWVFEWHYDPEKKKLREWDEYAGALATKRQSDAARQAARRARLKAEADAAAVLAGQLQPDLDEPPVESPEDTRNVVRATAGDVHEMLDATDKQAIARRLTIAANKGMEENRSIAGQYMPINAGRGDSLETVDAWITEGVDDWETFVRIVYTLAKVYEPEKPGEYIRSLVYFRYRALNVWKAHAAKQQATNAAPIVEVSIGAGETNGRRSPVARATAAAAGALAAGRAVGLPSEADIEADA